MPLSESSIELSRGQLATIARDGGAYFGRILDPRAYAGVVYQTEPCGSYAGAREALATWLWLKGRVFDARAVRELAP